MSAGGAEQDYWIATLGGATYDDAESIAVDSSGNVYIVGQTDSQGAGSYDALLAKYNASGTLQWQRVLGGATEDYAQSIAVDSSGNVYIAGNTQSQGAGGQDALIAKYNTSGTLQWQRVLGGASNDMAAGIAVDSSGNVYIAGYTQSQGAGGYETLIAKYNTSGTLQWQRILGDTNADYANGIAVDSSGNVYIAGITASQGAPGSDALIAKYDTSGTIQWQRILGSSVQASAGGIAVDSSGNVYIVGFTEVSFYLDILVAKYDTSGTLQWQRTLGSPTSTDNNFGLGIAVDSSGNVYITGYTPYQSAGVNDALIVKYNTSGTLQWQRILGGTGNDGGTGIAVDSSGNVYISGFTSQGAGSFDALIAKLPGDGSLTGTYGGFTYAVSTLTAATPTLTAATSTLTAATSTLTAATSTLTAATSTLTSTTITL